MRSRLLLHGPTSAIPGKCSYKRGVTGRDASCLYSWSTEVHWPCWGIPLCRVLERSGRMLLFQRHSAWPYGRILDTWNIGLLGIDQSRRSDSPAAVSVLTLCSTFWDVLWLCPEFCDLMPSVTLSSPATPISLRKGLRAFGCVTVSWILTFFIAVLKDCLSS